MSGIFICYRREDSGPYAGRLYDRLSAHFGRELIFMDIDTIEPGADFVDVINDNVGSCDVFIAVIGRKWVTNEAGRRRLENPEDFIRLEISAALTRKIRIIPVLVSGSTMPHSKDLPDDFAQIARRQALEISDTRFHQDVDRLIQALEKATATQGRSKTREEPQLLRRDNAEAQRAAQQEKAIAAKATQSTPKVSEGIYLDPQTRLMWTIEDNGGDISWNEASEYSKHLRLGGHSDWRLPTIEELKELWDPRGVNKNDIQKPFRLTGWRVWSSTTVGSDSAWYFYFNEGKRFLCPMDRSTFGRALCVRRSGE